MCVGSGGSYYQIPRRDLTAADWERLTEEQRALVSSSPLYEMAQAEKKAASEKKDG